MSKLRDKTILVTGGSKGIGLGCALRAMSHGAKVAVVSLQADLCIPAIGAARLDKSQVLAIDCDVRDEKRFAAAIGQTVSHFGSLDGVVNNAGWHPPSMTIEETSLHDFESLLRLNLTSTFLGCKLAIEHLKKSKGAIVNISSEVGLIGQGSAPAYVTTKAGQIGLTRALALDLAAYGIRVNAIAPAGVMTPLMQEWAGTQYDPAAALRMVDSWHPLGRMARTDEIGEVCAFLLSSEASFITGQVICPDGGAALGYRR